MIACGEQTHFSALASPAEKIAILYFSAGEARAEKCVCSPQATTTTTATKTSLANKHLGNGDYFAIIASSLHPLLLKEHATNGLAEAPLK